MIKVHYRAVDGFRKSRRFKTLLGARNFATSYIGESPEIASGYAVSCDGVGVITCEGCTLADLFHGPGHDMGSGHFELRRYGPRYGSRDEITGIIYELVRRYETADEARRALDRLYAEEYADGADSYYGFEVRYTGPHTDPETAPVYDEYCPF